MAFDKCMIMYIVYIQYSVLWVFALSMSDFDCLAHILNIHFKLWASQPIKKWFYICF